MVGWGLKAAVCGNSSKNISLNRSVLTLKDAFGGPNALFAIFFLQDKQWVCPGWPRLLSDKAPVVWLCCFSLSFPSLPSLSPEWQNSYLAIKCDEGSGNHCVQSTLLSSSASSFFPILIWMYFFPIKWVDSCRDNIFQILSVLVVGSMLFIVVSPG